MQREQTYDLILVGLGPVGGLAAVLAGRLGQRCLAVDSSPEVHPLPRAIHFDAEVMRIFQWAGLADRILELVRPATGSVHLGMDGEPIREFRVPAGQGPLGWNRHYMFSQPEIDGLLRGEAAELVRVELGWSCVDAVDDGEGVTATFRAPDGAQHQARGRYLLACDGASSPMRRRLGIEFFDFGFEEPWIIVDVLVPDADLGPDHMVMHCRPERPATYVPGPGRHRRWEFMVLDGDDPAELASTASIRRMIEPLAPWLDGERIEVLRSATYRFHGLVARRWREGRIFLAGDAVHQTPPFYGQGMCHGMRDVHNLLWKLALVIRDIADPDLLATYQTEREPHVHAVIAKAIENGRYICTLDPVRAAARDAEYRELLAAGRDVGSFARVIPPLTTGLLDAPVREPVGELLPQPLHDGRLLDELLGTGVAIVAADRLDASALPTWFTDRLGGRVVDGVEALRPWLTEHGCDLAVVRPDRYVFGVAAHGELEPLLGRLAALLAPVTAV